MRRSALGRMGRAIEPAFAPIGWDWKVAVAVIASFPAREVVVSTLGVLYDVSGDDDESTALRDRLKAARWEDGPRKGQPVFDLGAALALMVFFALCLQCVSTLAVMRKETGSWGWPAFAFAYMTALAYLGAWLTAAVTRALA
jgi:ferrous iron transport protein B